MAAVLLGFRNDGGIDNGMVTMIDWGLFLRAGLFLSAGLFGGNDIFVRYILLTDSVQKRAECRV